MRDFHTGEFSISKEVIEGLKKEFSGKIYTDRLTRWLYSTDASSYQVIPVAVAIPQNIEDVIRIHQWAQKNAVPLIPRGSGTSLSGQGIGAGIILDFTRHFDRILEIQPEENWAKVECGVVLDHLNRAAKKWNLMVGPDPSSSYAATLGGMTANNSTGSHSIVYGMMVDHVREVEVVLSDGSVAVFKPRSAKEVEHLSRQNSLEGKLYREIPALLQKYRQAIETGYPKTWRNVAGYNLHRVLETYKKQKILNFAPLIVNSEGTLATILSVKLGLVERPRLTSLVLFHYESLRAALSDVQEILEFKPSAVELLDAYFIQLTRQNPEYARKMDFIAGNPRAVLIIEFSGSEAQEVRNKIKDLIRHFRRKGYSGSIVERYTAEEVATVWQVRKAGLGLLLSKRGDAKPLAFIDDTAVPLNNLADYAEEVVKICSDIGTEAAFYAHASAGCLHINPVINLKSPKGLDQFKKISESVIDLAIQYGGTSTGEHGEGLARSYYNKKLFGEQLHQAFRELKYLFDPHNILNPGKIVDAPAPWDANILRFSPEYKTTYTIQNTHLDFSKDKGFSGMVEMCNGQGNCRQLGTGIMCPSFMVTRDEAHSTRGRANALRAAISGYLGENGLTDPQLYEVLDLCLSCKACRVECPSIVDMAKLKAEYLAARFEQTGIPLKNKFFAHVEKLNRLFARVKPLYKWGSQNGLSRIVLEKIMGIDRRRSLPTLAPYSFQEWFRKHQREKGGAENRKSVILWDDTFLSYNEPEIGMAAVEILEQLGFEVQIIQNRKCCGRPMVSQGLLKQARENARQNVSLLSPYMEQEIPLIVLEPSCLSMFREEYPDLLRSDAADQIAKQAVSFEEFLVSLAKEGKVKLPKGQRDTGVKIALHVHCHQRELNLANTQVEMLKLIPGTEVQLIDSGCCGMAGAFGYEKKHYEISMKIGADRLFPSIEAQSPDTLIAAAGTSCRHQIKEGTGKEARHPVVIFANLWEKSFSNLF